MTINELFDLCGNVLVSTSYSIYESVEDFDNCTSRFESYFDRFEIPEEVKNMPVGKFEISKHGNTIFIAIKKEN